MRPPGGAVTALVALTMFSCSVEHKSKPVAVEMCALTARPALYDGRIVRFSAHVMSDGIEHTLLFSPACSEFPLIVTAGPRREADVHELTDVIFGKERGTVNRDVAGTFIGTFKSPNRIELQRALDVVVRGTS